MSQSNQRRAQRGVADSTRPPIFISWYSRIFWSPILTITTVSQHYIVCIWFLRLVILLNLISCFETLSLYIYRFYRKTKQPTNHWELDVFAPILDGVRIFWNGGCSVSLWRQLPLFHHATAGQCQTVASVAGFERLLLAVISQFTIVRAFHTHYNNDDDDDDRTLL